MTPEILMVMGILAVVMVVLVTEIMPLEVLAMLVLGVLAITGLVSPTEALAGFSNPAVITIWAVFILSGGLTRTGIANILGRYLLKMAGSGSAEAVAQEALGIDIQDASFWRAAIQNLEKPLALYAELIDRCMPQR